MIPQHVASVLATGRYRLGHEALTQLDIADRFDVAKIPYWREWSLSPADRVDFLVDKHIAVEVKLKAPKRRIYRQIERYAVHDCVDSIILVTLTPLGMPPTIHGKPVFVVQLGLTAL